MIKPLLPLARYAEFQGRSTRSEYFGFLIFSVMAYPITILIIRLTISPLLGSILNPENPDNASFGIWIVASKTLIIPYALFIFVPYIAVLIRRLHDQGKSGYWLLILLVPYIGIMIIWILTCMDGDKGNNKYGPDPRNI